MHVFKRAVRLVLTLLMVLYKEHYFLGLGDHFSTYISSFSSFENDICVDVCIAIYYMDWALSSRIYGMESGIILFFFLKIRETMQHVTEDGWKEQRMRT